MVARDYKWGNMITLLKVMLSFSVGFSPISSFPPVKFLIDLLNYSIAVDIGYQLLGLFNMEVDKQMNKAFTKDPEYRVGNLTKKAVLEYIGKEEYNFGDVAKKVLESVEEEEMVRTSGGGGADADANKLLSIKFKFDMGEKERKVYHMSTKKKFHFVVVIYRFNKLVRSSSRMFI